jgi:hypothetical protein
MSYTPTVWNTGDVITAEKLNHAEQGIAANAIFHVVTFTQNGAAITCDHTTEQIAALISGGALLIGVGIFDGVKLLLHFTGQGASDERGDCYLFSTLMGDIDNGNIGSLHMYECAIYENGSAQLNIGEKNLGV